MEKEKVLNRREINNKHKILTTTNPEVRETVSFKSKTGKYEILWEKPQLVTRFSAKENTKTEYTVYPIRAIKSFGNVKIGEIGGCVNAENNLSQTGNCWIAPGGFALENAVVEGNAVVGPGAFVAGSAQITGSSVVEDATIEFDALVKNSTVKNNVYVGQGVRLTNSNIYDDVALLRGVELQNCTVQNYVFLSQNCHFNETEVETSILESVKGSNLSLKNMDTHSLVIMADEEYEILKRDLETPELAKIMKNTTLQSHLAPANALGIAQLVKIVGDQLNSSSKYWKTPARTGEKLRNEELNLTY